jgi:hypothetical protein
METAVRPGVSPDVLAAALHKEAGNGFQRDFQIFRFSDIQIFISEK